MNTSPIESKVTIDELATMVAKGFAGVDKRMDSFEHRLDLFELNMTGMEMRLSNKIDYVLTHYTRREEHVHLSDRVKKVEKKLKLA